MYQMLQKGEWQIADTCAKLIEAIPSRMHDEKKAGDILKVPGDALDDVADDVRYGIYTFITTTEKPLEIRMAEALKPLAEAIQQSTDLLRVADVGFSIHLIQRVECGTQAGPSLAVQLQQTYNCPTVNRICKEIYVSAKRFRPTPRTP